MYFCVTYLLAIKHENSTTTTLLLVTLLLVFFTSCKRMLIMTYELQPAENFDINKAPFDVR
jgi:hypothetical protein